MADGLLTAQLNAVDPDKMVIIRPEGTSLQEAQALVAAGPTNQEVLDACKGAYHQHVDAVDKTALGAIQAAKDPSQRRNVQALHAYNWNSKVAPPGLADPVFNSGALAAAREAAVKEQFLTFFLGIQAHADILVGVEGGVGVGFGIPPRPNDPPIWMAYGGIRLVLNIDVGVNLNTSLFLEPPKKVAGDYLGIEFSAGEVVEMAVGIHLSTDLKHVVGYSLGVGVGLALLPAQVAVVRGKIVTSA